MLTMRSCVIGFTPTPGRGLGRPPSVALEAFPMPRQPETRIVKLARVRSSENDGRRTLNFSTEGLPTPRSRRSSTTFVAPEHVPEFEGEAAWFLVEKVSAVPWSYWRALRQVEPPEGKN